MAPEEPPRRGWAALALPGELGASLTAGSLLFLGWAVRWAAPLAGEGAGAVLGRISQVTVWTSLAIGMVYGGRAAFDALRERKFDIDVLMVVAAGLAAATGNPGDGALLLFLFVLAGALEHRAMRRTMRAVEALHKLMPTAAQVFRGGEWVECDPKSLVAGEQVRIRPGETSPADAVVKRGTSSMDQSTLTGESLPRDVGEGDEVYAGAINLDNPIEAEVLRPAAQSSLQRILDLVIEAQQQREPIQRLIDRLSQPYAIGVMVVSTLVVLVWWLGFGVPLAGDAAHPGALYTAITLLIVASPCALVIATPTATLAAISRAARAGVLFKGGQSIDRLANIGSVCFDKTGTLTFGRPRLHQVHAVGWSDGRQMLAIAAAMEAGSTHPIAVAVVEAAKARGVEPRHAEEMADVPGRGLSARIGGTPARLGTFEHCEEIVPVCLRNRVREVLDKIRARGQLAVVVAWGDPARPGHESEGGGGQAAVLILSDALRPGAAALVKSLHALGVHPVRMLTGDNRVTAAHIAGQVGVDRYDAELLPQDKVRILQEMKEGGHGGAEAPSRAARRRRGVGFIGDGVNDAPALAAADASIAIGSIGSDAALESADIVLLNDDLETIPWAVHLARRTRAIVMFNIFFAMGVIVLMGATTLIGSRTGLFVPMWVAVLAHEGGTLFVVANSLRLLAVGRTRSPAEREGAGLAGAAPAAVDMGVAA